MVNINSSIAIQQIEPSVAQLLNDDVLFKLGTDGDILALNRSTSLAGNTALTGILLGTPVTEAIAANSLIISNITASGDIAFYVNKGGNSQMAFWADGSTGNTTILAASGASVDVEIAGTKILDYASGAFAFQQATTISTSATTLTLQPKTQLIIKCSDDADDYFTFDVASNIPTIYGTGAYTRFGDAAAPGHSLTSEDDVLFTGVTEHDGVAYFDSYIWITDDANNNAALIFGADVDVKLYFNSASDPDAAAFIGFVNEGNANNVPIFVWGDVHIQNSDLALFDGVTQPALAVIEKAGKYTSSTSGTCAGAGATLVETGKFTSSIISDRIRIISGTNVTAGWYWITTVTDANTVVLDRSFSSGASTNIVYAAYHSFTMLSADGVLLRITDGAPGDSSVEIDADGWLILDVSQANGRLYWRGNNGWHYVDATA